MLGKFLGFIFAPTGVLLGIWALQEMLATSPGVEWVAPGIGMLIALSMIIVGVRYVLKPRPKSDKGA
jgi:hypothetical protein